MNTVIITLDVPVQPERMRNYPNESFKIPHHEKMQGLKLGKLDDRHLSLLHKRFLTSAAVSFLCCCFLQVQKHATPEDGKMHKNAGLPSVSNSAERSPLDTLGER